MRLKFDRRVLRLWLLLELTLLRWSFVKVLVVVLAIVTNRGDFLQRRDFLVSWLGGDYGYGFLRGSTLD